MAVPKQINRTVAWGRLRLNALARKVIPFKLKGAFKSNAKRAQEMTVKTEHATYDYSRQLVGGHVMSLLFKLAKAAGLEEKIQAMFRGDKINVTENRSVLHTALRQQSDKPVMAENKDGVLENVIPGVKAVLKKVKTFTEEVHSGERKGVNGHKIKNIVAIGIGGSYLGPEYLAEACKAYAKEGMQLRFVANVDGGDFVNKTKDLKAEETMFIIISKTFTTAETLKNANTAKAWVQEKLGTKPEAIKKHFIAVSTADKLVAKFGIDTENNMFEIWDWVGGRYSATSAVGAVPLSLFLGYDKFEEILQGSNWMDQHFLNTPMEKNIPIIAGLIDIYNINFLGMRLRALLPYCQDLSRLAPHTQQVEMESNGKYIDLFSRVVKYFTGEAVFGEPGTNGQHSFYQLIHQGMKIPADIIAFARTQYDRGERTEKGVKHQDELFTNVIAQMDALAFGKTAAQVRADLDKKVAKGDLKPEAVEALIPHMVFQGNRPSSLLMLDELNPFTAGLLLAFTEHRTAVKGFIWGINSFDQFGVELGKQLGVDIRNRMIKYFQTGVVDTEDLNPSSASILRAYLNRA